MLLVIDIGNTNLVLGIFDGIELQHSWRVSTRRDQTPEEYTVLFHNLFALSELSPSNISAVVISSVVPPLNECFEELASRYFKLKAHFVDPENQSLMEIRYTPIGDVGADRIVNAIAAYRLYGGPGVVVDFGTATTFDVISDDGVYLGGIIAPGIGISAEALFQRAARLPRIDIRRPRELVGQSTVSSMQSGIFYGYSGLVDGILERLYNELGNPTATATGGFAHLICEELKKIDRIENDLTLHGLRIYYESIVKQITR